MRIVIITDPLEASRQIHSDGGQFVRELLSNEPEFSSCEVLVPTPRSIHSILSAVDHTNTAAIIFLTNALRHPESDVARAVDRNAEKITAFVEGGGGVLVLHQYRLGKVLLEIGAHRVRFQQHDGDVLPLAVGRTRSVLEVPNRIDHSSRPESGQESQLGSLVSWLALDEDELENFDVVLTSAAEKPLVAVSTPELRGRLAVCALPLDWHCWTELFTNLTRYVVHGDPYAVVWGGEDAFDPVAQKVLSSGGGVRSRTQPETDPAKMSPSPVLHIAGSDGDSLREDAGEGILATGGTILSLMNRESNWVGYRLSIGSHGYGIAESAMIDYRSGVVDIVAEKRDPYTTRNITLAAEHFARTYPMLPATWRPSQDKEFFARRQGNERFDGMTMTSALAALQVQLTVAPESEAAAQLCEVVYETEDSSAGEGMFSRAVKVAVGNGDPGAWLTRIVASRPTQAVMLSRIADWIDFIFVEIGAGQEVENSGVVSDMAALFTDILKDEEIVSLSAEAIANFLLGLCALKEFGAEGVDATVYRLVGALEERLVEKQGSDHISTRMRCAHALSRAEEVSPSGAHGLRELARLYSEGDEPTVSTTSGETLAERNKNYRQEIARLSEERQRHRLAVFVGKLVSTIAVIAIPSGMAAVFLGTLPDTSLSDLLIPAMVFCLILLAGLGIGARKLGLLPEVKVVDNALDRLWKRVNPLPQR